jgi:hypothetical protein
VRRRRLILAAAAAVGGLMLMHAVQALVGHAAFALAGPAVGAVVTGAVWAYGLRGRVRPAVALRANPALFVLLVVPEWVEGEFALGHEPDLLGHALPATVTIGAALLVFGVLEGRRTYTLLRDAFG